MDVGNDSSLGSTDVGSTPGNESSRILTARGTEDGLVLRIDGRSEWNEILGEIEAFLGSRRRFLEGGQVSVEWLERLPTKEQSSELEAHLQREYGITISGRRRRPAFTTLTVGKDAVKVDSLKSKERKGDSIPLFDALAEELGVKDAANIVELKSALDRDSIQSPSAAAIVDIGDNSAGFPETGFPETGSPSFSSSISPTLANALGGGRGSVVNRIAKILGEDLQYEEDANAKIVHGTLRSGQRIETPFSLIVVGDVNPGADLIAGGDIVVLGSLRGTAHAAAYDDDNQKRTIFALSMQPIQLRIGSVISRGSEEAGGYPEIARVENRRIVVEAFRGGAPSKAGFGKRSR